MEGSHRIGRLPAALALAAALVMMWSAPAAAAKPYIERNALAVHAEADCGTTSYVLDLTGSEILQVFFGQDDEVSSLKIHQNWSGDAVADDGTAIRVHHAFTITIDAVTGTWTGTGLGFGERVEGSSVSMQETGRLVITADGEVVFSSGQDDVLEAFGYFDPHLATCALFAAA